MTQWPPISHDLYIDPAYDLSHLATTALFYPCSGADLWTPISMFAPVVASLHFSDRGYFEHRHQDSRHYGLDVPVDRAGPITASDGEWTFTGRDVLPVQPSWRGRESHGLREQYRLTSTGKFFDVVRKGGHCEDAFEQLEEPLGIFFYRGDSLGEGGSGVLWNGFSLSEMVLDRLVDGGLFVTDGCNPDEFAESYAEGHPILSARYMEPEDDWRRLIGRRFTPDSRVMMTCVGHAGFRYGATLVWHCSKI